MEKNNRLIINLDEYLTSKSLQGETAQSGMEDSDDMRIIEELVELGSRKDVMNILEYKVEFSFLRFSSQKHCFHFLKLP